MIFKNETTKEYLLYEIKLTVLQGDPQEEISLSTCVRKSVSHGLTLENPIKKPVVFTLDVVSPFLAYPTNLTIEPLTEELLTLEYYPLFAQEEEYTLTVSTLELGNFQYKIKLLAKEAPPEPTVHFKCCLGQSVSQKVSVCNRSRLQADFRLKVWF